MSRTLSRVVVSLTLEGDALSEAGASIAGGVFAVSSTLVNKLRELYPKATLLVSFEELEDSAPQPETKPVSTTLDDIETSSR